MTRIKGHLYRPQNYSVMNVFTGLVILAVIFSALNDWGDWSEDWQLPALAAVFWFVAYLGIYKMWTIQITEEGYIISKSLKFQTDFKVKIATIERIGKGFYFLIPQNVPVIRYHSESTGKPLCFLLRPPAWGDKVIGQIIKDLVTINPSIKLDDYAKSFVTKT
jgi:hypothetical protein